MSDERDERLKEIEARVNAATEGPWGIWAMSVVSDPGNTGDMAYCTDVAHTVATDAKGHPRTWDATFIAHAREDIPWLIEQLRARNDDLISRKAAIEALREVTETLSPRYDEWNMRGYRQRPSGSYGEGVRDSQTMLRNLPAAAIVSESPRPFTDAQLEYAIDALETIDSTDARDTSFLQTAISILKGSSVAPESGEW